MELEWIPPLVDGGSKVTGYIVEFKEVNKEEEEKKAQRRLLLSEAEEEKEPESWEKVKKKPHLIHTGHQFASFTVSWNLQVTNTLNVQGGVDEVDVI